MKPSMPEKEKIFLSRREILTAIRIDFSQYPPQHDLFKRLCPIIFGDAVNVRNDWRQEGVWISSQNKTPHRFLSWQALGDYLYEALRSSMIPLEKLSKISGMVLQIPAFVGYETENGEPGIWVEMDMQDLRCRQCGQCCLNLNYHNECTREDYEVWRKLGRTDIMDWVGMADENGKSVPRHIWVYPGTNLYARVCPWLKKTDGINSYTCLIHDVKPEICRQYPGTRKHAFMTGCPGFET